MTQYCLRIPPPDLPSIHKQQAFGNGGYHQNKNDIPHEPLRPESIDSTLIIF